MQKNNICLTSNDKTFLAHQGGLELVEGHTQ